MTEEISTTSKIVNTNYKMTTALLVALGLGVAINAVSSFVTAPVRKARKEAALRILSNEAARTPDMADDVLVKDIAKDKLSPRWMTITSVTIDGKQKLYAGEKDHDRGNLYYPIGMDDLPALRDFMSGEIGRYDFLASLRQGLSLSDPKDMADDNDTDDKATDSDLKFLTIDTERAKYFLLAQSGDLYYVDPESKVITFLGRGQDAAFFLSGQEAPSKSLAFQSAVRLFNQERSIGE